MTAHTDIDTVVPDTEQVVAVTEQVWQAFLSAEEGELVVVDETDGELAVSGCVTISGGWEGAVILEVSSALARTAAARLFGTEPDEVLEDEVVDAVGELVNVVGGNIKSMLPGADRLSIPTVAVGVGHPLRVPSATLATRVRFTWLGEPLVVSVLRT